MASIKINASIPSGLHYTQYTMEIPLQVLDRTSGASNGLTAQEQIPKFVAQTIAEIHKSAAAVDSPTDLRGNPSPASSYRTTITRQDSNPQSAQANQVVKVTFDEENLFVQTTFLIHKHQSIHEALRGFKSAEGLPWHQFEFYHDGMLINISDTPESLTHANEIRLEVYERPITPPRHPGSVCLRDAQTSPYPSTWQSNHNARYAEWSFNDGESSRASFLRKPQNDIVGHHRNERIRGFNNRSAHPGNESDYNFAGW